MGGGRWTQFLTIQLFNHHLAIYVVDACCFNHDVQDHPLSLSCYIEKRQQQQTITKRSGTQNGGTVLSKAVLEVGVPLHKPYPYSLHRWGFLHFRYLKCLVNLSYRNLRAPSAPRSNKLRDTIYDNSCKLHVWWYGDTVDGYNPAPVEVGVSHYLQGFSTIPDGWEWDFWTINSTTTAPVFYLKCPLIQGASLQVVPFLPTAGKAGHDGAL